jgi:molybdopterin-guanine dinucleotide biosynthesis protein B
MRAGAALAGKITAKSGQRPERTFMVPIVSIVGKSDSGKTTLIEKLVPELSWRGYKVATIKHDVHGFEVDREGKDSWRHRKAGARCTVISSPQQLALLRDMDHDATLDEIRSRFIDDVHLIITEGYKREAAPKVEIFRKAVHTEPLCVQEDNLVALVSDADIDLGVPRLDLDDIGALADIIEDKFLKEPCPRVVKLSVNGNHVFLKPFIETMIKKSITGIIAALKGCSSPERIEITIK